MKRRQATMEFAKNTEEQLLKQIDLLERQIADLKRSGLSGPKLCQSDGNAEGDLPINSFGTVFKNMQNGFAYHKIVTDTEGNAIDYIFLEINKGFEKLTGLKESEIIGKCVTDVLPGIENAPSQFIMKYGDVALNGGDASFEIFSEPLNRWYSVYAYCPQKGYFISMFEDITERKKTEETLNNIVTKFSAYTGVDFFDQACCHLYELLQTDIVIVGRYSKEDHIVEVVSGLNKGKAMDPFVYSTLGTPCYAVLKSDDFVHHRNLQDTIQKDHILLKMGMEEYAGIPLFSREGTPIGIIALMNSKPMENLELSKSLLRSFSQKVVAEMERMSWEDKLSASENLNRSITESAGDAIISFDSEGIILSWNNAASKIFGFSASEMLGENMVWIIPEQMQKEYFSKLRELKNKNFRDLLGKRIELTTRSKKGSELVVEVILSHWTKNNQDYYTSIIRDISERDITERALWESEDKFKSVFNNSPIGICTTDLQGYFIDANPALCKILGYTREEMVSKHFNDFTHPDDVQKNKEIYEQLVKGKITTSKVEKRYIHKNGDVVFVYLKGQLIYDNKGIPVYETAIIEDVTERKKEQAKLIENRDRLKAAQKIAKLGHYSYNFISNLWTSSIELDKIFGIDENYEKNIESWQQVIHPDFRSELINYFQINIFQNHEKFDKVYKIVDQFTFQEKWIHGLGELKFDENNNPVEMFGTCQDITESKLAEEALEHNEAFLKAIFNSTGDGLLVVGNDRQITHKNSQFLKMWKIPQHLQNNTDDVQLINCVLDQLKYPDQFLDKINKLYDSVDSFYDLLFFKDGRIFDHSSHPLILNNKISGRIWGFRDITKTKQVEVKLQQSEVRFKKLFENLGDAVYVSKLGGEERGKILEVNPEAVIQTGYSREELLQMNIIDDFVLLKQEGSSIQGFEEKLLRGETVSTTEQKRRKDGVEYWVETKVSPFEFGGQKACLSLNHDITDRKIAMEELRKSEQVLSLHINQTLFGVIEWELDFTIKKWNPAAERIFGYSKQEAVGKSGNIIVPDEGKKQTARIWRKLVNSVGGNFSANKNINKNGDILHCEWHNTLLVNASGEVIAIVSLIEDVTEKNRTERIQKVLYNISNEVIRSNSLNELLQKIRFELGTIIDTTNFYVALYDEYSDKISMPFFTDEKDAFSKFPKGKTLTGYVLKTTKSLFGEKGVLKELETQGKIERIGAESEIWMGVPLRVEKRTIGVLAVQSYSNKNAYDKSDLRILEFVSDQISLSIHRFRTEENLLKALGKATESDRLKSAFLATMSHELRTPLNAIIGFSEFLDKDLPHEDVAKFGEIIYSSGNHLLSIVNDLFEITLIEAGEVRIRNEIISLKQLLDEIRTIIIDERQRTYKEEIDINLILPKERQDLIIQTDPNKLKQVILNLLKNAVKFTVSGYVNYGFELEMVDGNQMLKFFVKDSGIGIAKEKQEYIFEIFRQAQDSKSRKYNGTGIGLSVAKRLVEILGGNIGVESEENKGSLFYFYLPLIEGNFEQQVFMDELAD